MKSARIFAAVSLLFLSVFFAAGQAALITSFADPPRSCRPQLWWHWMNGNITKDAIRADIEWMDSVGISGFHVFDAGFDTPQVVPERLVYMTEEWKDAFSYALDVAAEHNMEVGITSSPGWSLTGGPWVEARDAMKTLVWTETAVSAGQPLSLPQPSPACCDYPGHLRYPSDPGRDAFYEDIAVIAVRLPAPEPTMEELGVRMSRIAEGADSLGERVMFEFPREVCVKAFSYAYNGRDERGRDDRTLEYSPDGVVFLPLLERLPSTTAAVTTVSVPETRARFFRFRSLSPDGPMKYTELRLIPGSRVNLATEKSAHFTSPYTRDFFPTPDASDAALEVLDLTALHSDGVLRWTPSSGHWVVYRFGYVLTGKRNGPASPEATGLEVDKLDKDAVRRYYQKHFGMYDDASGGRLGTVIKHLQIDSYESGCQTWTRSLPLEFERRCGYSLLPWMPALAGRVIFSSAQTERFLCDWRRCLGDMIVENHYEAVDSLLAARGMDRFTEAQEYSRVYLADGMDVKRRAAFPMSGFWTREEYGSYECSEADMRESSSVAHIYGQNICASESFTVRGTDKTPEGTIGAFDSYPGSLKRFADGALAEGVNKFVIHSCVLQPDDSLLPGLTLSEFGQWFNRHETWAREAKPWTDYLSRSAFLMQQGRNVADIAYYYSETTNVVARFKLERPPVPFGHCYDFVNRLALLEALEPCADGHLRSAGGADYRVLMIDSECRWMSTDVLEAILRCAEAGVIVCGAPPQGCCNLQADEAAFFSLVDAIWRSGRENVVQPEDLSAVLDRSGILPSVSFSNPDGTDIRFVHRHLDGGGGELFWIANINPQYRDLEVTFAVPDGLRPVILHADSGLVERPGCGGAFGSAGPRGPEEFGKRPVGPASRTGCAGVTLTLHLTPDDAQFVLFEKPEAPAPGTGAFGSAGPRGPEKFGERAPESCSPCVPAGPGGVPAGPEEFGERPVGPASRTGCGRPEPRRMPLKEWTVSFQSGRGAPEEPVHLDSLIALNESPVPGIRYFSGTATYTTTFDRAPGAVLHLGRVCNMAHVWLNGKNLGLVWKEPYVVDVSGALVEGRNELKVEVINSWVNRIIGDLRSDGGDPVTWTAVNFYTAASPLRDSGLIGPVFLMERY